MRHAIIETVLKSKINFDTLLLPLLVVTKGFVFLTYNWK